MARRVKLEHTAPKSERENRPVRVRRYKMFILIVCEDTKTEPAYFESFKKQIPQDTYFYAPWVREEIRKELSGKPSANETC